MCVLFLLSLDKMTFTSGELKGSLRKETLFFFFNSLSCTMFFIAWYHFFFTLLCNTLTLLTGFYLEKLGWEGNRMYTPTYSGHTHFTMYMSSTINMMELTLLVCCIFFLFKVACAVHGEISCYIKHIRKKLLLYSTSNGLGETFPFGGGGGGVNIPWSPPPPRDKILIIICGNEF